MNLDLTIEELKILDAVLRRHRMTRPMDVFMKDPVQENLQLKLDQAVLACKEEVPTPSALLGVEAF